MGPLKEGHRWDSSYQNLWWQRIITGPPTYHFGSLALWVQDPESSLVSSLHPHCWQPCHSSGLEGTQENHSLGKYLLSTECV